MNRWLLTPCRLSTAMCVAAAFLVHPEHASHLDLWMLPPAVRSAYDEA